MSGRAKKCKLCYQSDVFVGEKFGGRNSRLRFRSPIIRSRKLIIFHSTFTQCSREAGRKEGKRSSKSRGSRLQNETGKRTSVCCDRSIGPIAFGKIRSVRRISVLLHLEPRGYHPGEQTLPTTNSAPSKDSSLLMNAVTER